MLVHHTNPVGTEWRWKMDQPELILKEAIENHQNMIKQFKAALGAPICTATLLDESVSLEVWLSQERACLARI
ncbi:hypothetical protein U0070_012709 [Myodes glareolus]|uniref:Uncharacterized protein n=1 Tax=Myodes glareolus TaxID=447135 RepID=A0AAW0JRM6_MYOGA